MIYSSGNYSKIDDLNLPKRTIVILTANRGIDLIPLIIKHPRLKEKRKRIKIQIQLIDFMPAILDFLNIPFNKEA